MWFSLSLILLALSERLIWNMGPNWELVTAVTIVAGMYMKQKYALLVPLVIMSISDSIMGVSAITWFTWSGFLAITLFPGLMKRFIPNTWGVGLISGISGVIFYYLWTNGGVWLTDVWGMYPKTGAGLLACYINGLPFLRNQLMSSMIAITVLIFVIESVKSLTSIKTYISEHIFYKA